MVLALYAYRYKINVIQKAIVAEINDKVNVQYTSSEG